MERIVIGQSENENETDTENNSLPDLPSVVNQTLSSKSANTRAISEKTDSMPIELISPPAIERHTEAPKPTLRSRARNLGDLLCTLNFNQVPANVPTPVPRKVVTSIQDECRIRSSLVELRSASAIVTISSGNSSPAIESPVRLDSSCKVVTPKLLPQDALTINTDRTDSPEHVVNLYTPKGKTTDEPTDNQNEPPSDIQASGTDSTPRSVITNPDANELETANVLLQLGNTPNSFDANYDNSEVLPVDAAPLDDFTRTMHEEEENNKTKDSENSKQTKEPVTGIDQDAGNRPDDNNNDNNNNKNNDDITDNNSEETVDYNANQAVDQAVSDEELESPKGKLRYKHYGIVRQSPTTGKPKIMYCSFCEARFDSKKKLNNHHKAEHTRVKCPDCSKVFPTPDALQRHRYLHKESHRFKCALCNKICAFKSDLDLHMAIHNNDRIWYCTQDGCNRDFKRKSDLTAHEVVHKGEDFMCEFPTCSYTNKDPQFGQTPPASTH